MNETPAEKNGSNRLWAFLQTYRIYWMTPIVLGLALLALVLIFADSETLGRFSYFNF